METRRPNIGTETKATAHNGEIKAAMGDFLNAFEHFKSANDERLAELEEKNSEDVLLREKVDRIDAALTDQKASIDRLALAAARPGLNSSLGSGFGSGPHSGPESGTGLVSEHKAAFQRYMRAGEANAVLERESKSLNFGTPSEGGYVTPEETEAIINAAIRDASPFRQIASVRSVGANIYKKPVSLGGTVANWVGETATRPETTTPSLASLDFQTAELYAMPAASQTMLDDAVVNVEQWLADEVQAEFAAQETTAFINGNGTNKPTGLLNYTKTQEASRGASEIGYIATGADGDFAASDPSDILLDLIYTPKQAYRANGRFLMNRATVSNVRKFKDADGNYLWQPSTEAGAPSTLMGYAVSEAEDMPGITSGSYSIAFGDFRRGYLIVDRQGLRVLRDPYSAKPYVLFYTTKRVGGGVQDFDAIKLLKFSAS
ncbi:MAG: phage major capsid protein [Pseudomonadota bacterium]